MKKSVVLATCLSGVIGLVGNAFALTVSPFGTADDLVNNILGSGITVVGSASYTGANLASGTFTGGLSSGIGIESGILLTSGTAAGAVGPNLDDAFTGDNGLAGDANLDALVPGYQTHDATSLEFTFTTTGGDLYFNYAFASEEYNEWTNSPFNDVFGFFLDGINIALIPGTTTPVSINNVNGGNPLGTDASNPALFNNNDPSNGIPTPYDLQYDGFTDVFTASVLGLGAGEHTIKLAIADAGDWVLDSGVFIQAGTFSSDYTPPAAVPEPGTLLLFGGGLVALGLIRKRKA